jgi:5'-3' exoribonuclease 1
MGIPAYFKWVVKRHRKSIKEFESSGWNVDNLYIDANSTIYDGVRMCTFSNDSQFENDIINFACRRIENYAAILKPNICLYIAFDGVAPVAKLEQQRTRRFKTQFDKKIRDSLGIPIKSSEWSTANITPGTLFMTKLTKKVVEYFNVNKVTAKKVCVSGAEEAGEGEHKIFEMIRTDKRHKEQVTICYGLDADLIMLSLHHLQYSAKIGLYRETPEFIKSIDSGLNPNQSYLLDIPVVAEAITNELNDGKAIKTESQRRRMFDYIVMCFFLGNDFLPHFPAINIRGNGISILTSAYKETVSLDGNLTSETGIRWRGIRAFVKRLAAIERETIIKEGENRDKQSKHTYPPKKGVSREEIALEAIPLNDRGVENYINASEDGWRERYYDVLFDCDASDERIREICINYAEGLEWTLNYYSGSCIDWEWCYKYHYPPLLSDLLNYLPYFDCDILTKKPKSPLPSLVQLGYVLPGQCLSILPSKVHRVLIENHPEWYVSDVKLQWAFCRYLWEAHAELPQIDIGELRKLIETVM